VVADVRIEVTNSDTNVRTATTTNNVWDLVVTGIPPGRYRMAVTKEGFRSIVVTDVTPQRARRREQEFNLDVGAFLESITVTEDQLNMNTTAASVSTVWIVSSPRTFRLNGRSFQSLIRSHREWCLPLTTGFDTASFSVNGQRANSNYWMVDGVSANIGVQR